MDIKYKKVLFKISGEELKGESAPIDYDKAETLAKTLAKLSREGVKMGLVIGGGNIFRGRDAKEKHMERSDADSIGMLATVINAMAMKNALIQEGAKARVMSAIPMERVCDAFTQRGAVSAVDSGEIVIFAAGTGCPYLSTDTAAALRALEIGADALLCAKNIDGVYDCDPRKFPDAKRFNRLTCEEVMRRNLNALDMAATALCHENGLPTHVFKLTPENLEAAVRGDVDGTYVANDL